MNRIILTKDINEGNRLKLELQKYDSSFTDIICLTKEKLQSSYCKVEYIFSTWYMPSFTKEEIKRFFPNLKAVFYAAGTVKYFADSFLELGISVYSAASANATPVAEYTAAQIILANKGYYQSQRLYRWPIFKCEYNRIRSISERKGGNYNAKIGVIGCGAVGSMVVNLLKPYKLHILVYDPYLPDSRAQELNVKKTSLADLFQSCDVITNHLPDIAETKGIINYELLSTMKSTATFINTGRGNQVVEKDLVKVLRKNKEMCALLDVTQHEPLFPWSSLYWCNNVFLTPHIAGSQGNEFGRMVEYMINAYEDSLAGVENPCKVSLEQLAHQA